MALRERIERLAKQWGDDGAHGSELLDALNCVENDETEQVKRKRILLSVKHRRLNGRGFGCYFAGTARRGSAEIIVDCDALAFVAAQHRSVKFKRQFIETLGHEFMHALEDIFGLMFDEKKIETAIERSRP